MQTKCSLCLIHEKELAPFIQKLKNHYPAVDISLEYHMGSVDIVLTSNAPVDALILEIKKGFPTFFFEQPTIAEAVHHEFLSRGKTLALGESCSGGMLASKLIAMPRASEYFQGSIVAYSNKWKERLLHVSRTSLEKYGAASSEVAVEMVKGLLDEFDTDYAVSITGVLGPNGGTQKAPRGTVFVAIAKRGERIDVGSIFAPLERINAMHYTSFLILGALWRRIVYNAFTFS